MAGSKHLTPSERNILHPTLVGTRKTLLLQPHIQSGLMKTFVNVLLKDYFVYWSKKFMFDFNFEARMCTTKKQDWI